MLPSSVRSGNLYVPLVGRVVILHAAFHILQLIQHSEHVDELAEGEQVCLRHKVFSALCVTQPTDLSAKAVDGCALKDGHIFYI